MRVCLWIVCLLLASATVGASAAPPDFTMGGAIAAAKCELVFLRAHRSDYIKLAPDTTVRGGGHGAAGGPPAPPKHGQDA